MSDHEFVPVAVDGIDRELHFAVHDVPDVYISDGIRDERRWEPLETAAVVRLLSPGSVFVDCGANLGWYSVVAAARGARVVAFEPDAANLELLRRNVERNEVDARVEIHPAAVGARPGRARLALADDNRGDHRLTELAERDHTVVEVQTLDDAVGRRRVDVLKLDTQGSEVAILDGGSNVLDRFEQSGSALIAEYWPHGLASCGSSYEALLEYVHRFVDSGFVCFELSERLDLLRPTSVDLLRASSLDGDYRPESGGHTNVMLVRPQAVRSRLLSLLDPQAREQLDAWSGEARLRAGHRRWPWRLRRDSSH